MKKKKPAKKKKPDSARKIPSNLAVTAKESDVNDFGGMDLSNFKKNLGCGG